MLYALNFLLSPWKVSGVETLGITALVVCPVEVVLVAGPAEVDGVGLGALARWVSVRWADIPSYVGCPSFTSRSARRMVKVLTIASRYSLSPGKGGRSVWILIRYHLLEDR